MKYCEFRTLFVCLIILHFYVSIVLLFLCVYPSLGIDEVSFALLLEEKKPVKRTYQKVQEEEEEEDDDYRCHGSPHVIDASGPQLVRDHSNNLDMTFLPALALGLTHLVFSLTHPSYLSPCPRRKSWSRPCRTLRTQLRGTRPCVRKSPLSPRRCRTCLCWRRSLVRPEQTRPEHTSCNTSTY